MSDQMELNDMGNGDGDMFLWYGNDDNKNSQEVALAEEADRQSPILSQGDPSSASAPHVDWDSQSYDWINNNELTADDDSSTARFWHEFLGEEMPARVASTCSTPRRCDVFKSSPMESSDETPASGGNSVSTIFTPSSLEEHDEKPIAKAEPVSPGVVCTSIPPTHDILQSAISASDIGGGMREIITTTPRVPTRVTPPTAKPPRVTQPRADADIANKTMIPVMHKYGFNDENLFDISLSKLKRTVRSCDLKKLSSYRRTIMNRSYARKSRGVKQTASLSMEQELKQAQDRIHELETEMEVKDDHIRQLEFQNEFLAACGSGTHEISTNKQSL